jgi:hypothetical protein
MRLPRAALGAVVLGGVLLAGVGAGTTFYFADDQPPLDPELDAQFRERLAQLRPGRVLRGDGSGGDDLPTWVALLLDLVSGLVVLAVLAAGAWAFLRGLRRLRRLLSRRGGPSVMGADVDPGDRSDDDADTPLRRRLRAGLDLGAGDLDSGAEAGEVVIACFQRLETAAREVGSGRRPEETPTELVVRLLADHDVPPSRAHQLVALYEHARFSPHPVDATMRAEARACLDDVRRALVPA